MNKLTKQQLAKRKLAMRTRAILRLKAQEQYVDDLNAVLPDLEKKFDAQVNRGILLAPIDIEKAITRG